MAKIFKGQITKLALAVIVAGGTAACTKDFKDINTSPLKPTDADLQRDNLKTGGFYAQQQKSIIPAGNNATNEVNEYQLAENLQADMWSGYMGTPTPFNGGKNNSTYSLMPGWMTAAFAKTFTGVMPAWKQIKDQYDAKSDDLDLKAAFALAQIIKVFGVSRTTDMYGPLPYLDYGKGGSFTKYDSQQAIYNSFFTDLDDACKVLKDYLAQRGGKSPNVPLDLVYTGDYAKWIKFANTLRLRLAMRIVYADPATAQRQAEATVTNGYGFIDNAADNAYLHTTGSVSVTNPIAFIQDVYGDMRAGASYESILKGLKDDRLTKTLKATTSGEYRGIRVGIDGLDKNKYTAAYSTLNLTNASPVQWMTSPEVYFLKAEGALRGWNMGGSAQSFYTRGVTESFNLLGAGGLDAYLANDVNTAADYTDIIQPKYNIKALSKVTVKWNEGADMETKLEKIITQKWIALFPDGQEAWSEYRRTHYPKLLPVGENYSGGTISTDQQIRRIQFSRDEYSSNAQGVQSGLALLGGPDNGGTRLWWDKKPF